MSIPKRLPEQKSLYQLLPKGTEGGKEFARAVDLLIFHDGRRAGRPTLLFSDAAGDYRGLDSLSGDRFRREGATGYQYKFYPSPLSPDHRRSIEDSLVNTAQEAKKLKLKRWILVTPEDLLESSAKKGGGDVTWFEGLRKKHKLGFEVEHWGHKKLLALFLQTPFLCLYYYPSLVDPDHSQRRSIADIRKRYDDNLLTLYRDVQFVGMSVYKQEATRGVPIQDIYIPLTLVSEAADSADELQPRQNPLSLLEPGSLSVVLGDPGSGKSTLLRFLALAGISDALQTRYEAKPDDRLPVVVTLRRYGDELKVKSDLALIDYILQSVRADFSLNSADQSFFEFYLESGRALLLFDGLDELPSPHFKSTIRDRIRSLLITYPGNTAVMTSRVVGYEEPFRFDAREFPHWRLASLRLPEIEQFVRDWYRCRIESKVERERNIADLLRIVSDNENTAIRELSRNPLLLTIVTLVHRIDAVLPDERVVLYQKCTETLLNTWHTWKYRETEQRNRGRIERRNRVRMEAIAHWMHMRSVQTGKTARAVVPVDDLKVFLTEHVRKHEPSDPDTEPEDAAVEFLEFVRRRTGLLVEAGDGLYSFVHLTFQEYLTAMHIATDNEAGGAPAIWNAISPHVANPRWHEVVRLLLGGRAFQTQAYLLERLLAHFAPDDAGAGELLGGLLLDSSEPAELRAKEIVERLVSAAVAARTPEDCERVVRVMRAWRSKDAFDEELVRVAMRRATQKGRSTLASARVLASPLGVDREWLYEWQAKQPADGDLDAEVGVILYQGSEPAHVAALAPRLQKLADLLSLTLTQSEEGTFIASALQAVFGRAIAPVSARCLFQLQLASLIGGPLGGPFKFFTANTVRVDRQSYWRMLERIETRVEFHESVGNLESAVTGLMQTSIWSGRDILGMRCRASLGARELGALEHAVGFIRREDDLWESSIAKHMSSIVTVLLDGLGLDPRASWQCALNYTLPPAVSARLWLLEPEVVARTEQSLESGKFTETECFVAAWHLLLDTWLMIHGRAYTALLPGRRLHELVRGMSHPALQVAQAIRDLAANPHARPETLVSLARDPKCQDVLSASGLQTPKVPEPQPRPRSARKRPSPGRRKK
jgi:hypothetical protein